MSVATTKPFAFEKVEPPTLKTKVADSIQNAVLDGSLSPGAHIVETRIAKELGVSQTTVREAVQDLANQGLLVRRVNRESIVRQLTSAEMEKLFRVRIDLEGLAVELAYPRVTERSLEPLTGAIERMRHAAAAGNMPDFYRCDIEFHRLLSKLPENQFLERAMAPLTIGPIAFVLAGTPVPLKTDYVQVANDHLEILAGFSEKSAKKARRIVEARLHHWHQLQLTAYGDGSRPVKPGAS